MKKNVIFRVAAIVVMCALVTACFASSTFARYTSTATSNETSATVAKWSFEVGGTEIAKAEPQTFTVNLFNTIYDSDATSPEGDVSKGLIAPGTSGKFDISVKNTSEVTAQYTLKVKATCSDALKSAITVKVGGTAVDWSKADKTTGYVTVTPALNTLGIGSAASNVSVTWDWPIGDNDTYTDIGIEAQSGDLEYALDFILVAEQVD